MNWLRHVLVLLLALAGVLASPDSRAETVCTASMSDLNFGLANTSTAVIDYECVTTNAFLSGRADVAMCFAIGPGSSTGSTVTQRRMNNADNDTLNFVIHRTASNPSDNWGDSPPEHYQLIIDYPLTGGFFSGGSERGQITVYGRIPSRTGLAAGDYSSTFNSTDLDYRYRDSLFQPAPTSCNGPGQNGPNDSFPFTARANVPGSCSVVTASDMSFSPGGMPLSGTSTGNLTSTSTINLTCTNRTAWQVGLDEGQNPSGGGRQMCNPGGACIAYQLNQPDGFTPWGDDLDVNTVDGISAGTQQTLTVKGRVNDQPLTQAGRYSDTVKVILTY
ncbi:MAG: Csu type fimbrial protein [Lysobacter sp.]